MFKPSTAPRWKMATSIFLRPAAESAAKAERDSHAGMAPTPNIARAEPFRNTRLDGILWLPLLKIGRSNHQRCHQRRVLLLVFKSLVDRRARLGRHRTD